MASILKSIRLTRDESPIAFVVFPIAAFVFLATTCSYVALMIASY